MELTYVLPIRSMASSLDQELTDYLRWLAGHVEVIVVDGSPPEVFAAHVRAWARHVAHVKVDDDVPGRNGKVRGVLTGLRAATHDRVILADDDVRYDLRGLHRMAGHLEDAELVRPQNYFRPAPWHARWDAARSLLNRAVLGDYPGTMGVRKSLLARAGGYDSDVLFENLELIRTVRCAGGRVATPLDFYVRRLPPALTHFRRQRVRQAYDDLAQPWRLVTFLAVLPAVGMLVVRRRWATLTCWLLAAVGAAERGRRRAGGRQFFPATASLFAPVWIAERAACSWFALYRRVVRGGVHYAGAKVVIAANPTWRLRQRLA